MLKLNCIESLTAIGIGVGACALAPLDAGLTAGAVIGGAGLFARIRENLRKPGVEEPDTIRRVQKEVLRDWDHWQNTQERRDAVTLADAAMTRWLPTVMMTREELAATATESGDDDERYPVIAARKIADRLALHDVEFAPPAAGQPEPLARQFARQVIERALRAAKNDRDYATFLTLDIAIELGRAIAENGEYLARIEAVVVETAGGVERIEALMLQMVEEYRPAAAKLKVTEEALVALARRIAAKVDSPEEAFEQLGRAIEEFLRQRDTAAQGTNFGDLVDQTLRNVAAANERGELDKGAAAGERGFAEWQEKQKTARQAGLRLIEANIEQQRLRFDATAIARWIGERLKLSGGGAIDFQALRAEQNESYQRGLIGGLRLDTDVSIALARLSIDIAQSDTDWAMGQNDLAVSLSTQGERTGGEAGLALLADAVAAYRAALTVYTESAMPADWAMTQNNLGTALSTQGERTGGEAGLALLADAVAAYRAALTVYTESTMPAQWAMTQNNLGNALSTQGERTGGQAGLSLLAEAVAAYRAALTV
ncbi:MAG: tetratricopeptide repeat protein, partial [Sphingomonas sp.]|nr:tetratricopeptide repeat protein [Sphingomonas sp.]